MSNVLNEWLATDNAAVTKLRITGVYSVDVAVDTQYVEHLKHLSWCYEQTKGQVYAMDFSMETPSLLGITSPRVYLWKYVVYLHTGRIAKAWRRDDLSNYCFNHGAVLWHEYMKV